MKLIQPQTLSRSLPHSVFFEPTEEFFDYLMRTYTGRPIVDVGAGAGWLSKQLHARGYKVLAIDIFPRDNPLYPVAPLDATTMQFPKYSFPIMARPCHSEWIENAVNNAMRTVNQFLYVGLEKNFSDDLSELTKYKLTYESFIAGKEDERCVLIEKP